MEPPRVFGDGPLYPNYIWGNEERELRMLSHGTSERGDEGHARGEIALTTKRMVKRNRVRMRSNEQARAEPAKKDKAIKASMEFSAGLRLQQEESEIWS